MTVQTHEATGDTQVAENVATTLHRAQMKQQQLATAVGMTGATLSRRMADQQPWLLWEVQAIAEFLGLSLAEITTDLPTRSEWQVRWDELRACRDSNPKPSVLEFPVNRWVTLDLIPGDVREDASPRRSSALLRAVS